MFRDKTAEGLLEPLVGNLQSAYNQYNTTSHITEELVTRMHMQPLYTNYTVSFKGALDHILHNEKLRVLELLEMPELSEI